MSRFFRLSFDMHVIDAIKSINLPMLCGEDADTHQHFVVGKVEDFATVVSALSGRGYAKDFDGVQFVHFHDGGDDATLEMFHDWESGLKGYMYSPKRVGIHYVYNHEPFDTLYHAAAYARQCNAEISDDNSDDGLWDYERIEREETEREFLAYQDDLF